jgi:23S rRNA (cytidine2498-2'-O)-methyltransferase
LPPAGALGAFTLLDRTTLLASARKTSPFPDGVVRFVEDKTGPPNRAYLKLWEAWLHMGEWPRPGEQVIDLGAAPGGWTYAAAALGAAVLAVDKAPLDPRVAALEGVTERRESAFALDPRQVGPVDWVICDVVCYPERLRHLVEAWRTAGAYRRAIFTVKFQGPPGLGVLDGLREYSGSTLKHLSCNKNEVTLLDRPPVG